MSARRCSWIIPHIGNDDGTTSPEVDSVVTIIIDAVLTDKPGTAIRRPVLRHGNHFPVCIQRTVPSPNHAERLGHDLRRLIDRMFHIG